MAFQQQTGIQGTYRGEAVTKQKADIFIPEMWSGEVKRALDQKFIAKQFVKMKTGDFKKGDRVHIPNISRARVYDKLPETPVTLQARTESDFYFDIDTYKESSFFIEDIVGIQASYNLRSEYTREAGYAMARDIDSSVLALRAAINGVSSQVINNTSDGTLNGNSFPLNYTALLTAKLILDNADVDDSDRALIVSPTQYNQLLAVDKFINMDYRNGSPVSTGVVGTIFNIPVYMTTQVGRNSSTGYVNGTENLPTPGVSGTGALYLPKQDSFTSLPVAFGGANTGAAAQVHTALLVHKDWAVMAMQQEPKTETSRETLYLADAVVMSTLYGMRLFRPANAVVIHTNAVLPAVAWEQNTPPEEEIT